MELASLVSGYFLRRHFNTFIGRECGALGQRFIDRAQRLGHLKPALGRGAPLVYHVSARAVYEKLGDPKCRNRREHRPDTIRRRLMILDYVIAQPEQFWLLTEPARYKAFASWGVAAEYRNAIGSGDPGGYRDGRQPVAIEATGSVSFAFVDAGLRSLLEWERFLRRHRPLFSLTKKADLIYAACDSDRFRLAESLFRRIIAGEAVEGCFDLERLQAYFHARKLFEQREYTSFNQAKLDQLREDQRVYAGEILEEAYGRWRKHGDAALCDLRSSGIRFGTQLLPHAYAWLSPLRVRERRPDHGLDCSRDKES